MAWRWVNVEGSMAYHMQVLGTHTQFLSKLVQVHIQADTSVFCTGFSRLEVPEQAQGAWDTPRLSLGIGCKR